MKNLRLPVAGICLALFVTASIPYHASAEGKRLNSFVVELLQVSRPKAEQRASYRFNNPRDGWIFISSNATTPDGAKAYLIIDSQSPDAAVILHGRANHAPKGAVTADSLGLHSVIETMRRLPAGEHVLNVYCEGGATVEGVVVRSIPEIFYAEIGYWSRPAISKHNPFTWEFIKRIGLAENLNTVNTRNWDSGFDDERWRAQGKKVLTAEWTHDLIDSRKRAELPFTADWAYEFLKSTSGIKSPDRDGIIMSEFDGFGSQDKEYPALTEAVRRLSNDPAFKGKVYYPYTVVLYSSEPGKAFAKEIANAGSKIAEERYLSEVSTEEQATELMKNSFGYVLREYQRVVPDFQKHMVWALGYMSAPTESLNTNPAVNYPVFLEMQFNYMANNPSFDDTYGIMCYHSAYTDEETMRWSSRLFRHYCIEGRKDMLSDDPYMLPHLQNPDFADGASGWSLTPAEDGSITTGSVAGYGRLQGRYTGQSPQEKGLGDDFLLMKRSQKGPNRVSQQIKALEPGRLYSLKLFVADRQELMSGKSANEKHQVGIQISNATLVPYKSFQETFPTIISHMNFTPGENPLWSTYYFLVFRANADTATLSISDWISDDRSPWPADWGLQFNIGDWTKPAKPGGRIGQELIFNFVELQPYLDEER